MIIGNYKYIFFYILHLFNTYKNPWIISLHHFCCLLSPIHDNSKCLLSLVLAFRVSSLRKRSIGRVPVRTSRLSPEVFFLLLPVICRARGWILHSFERLLWVSLQLLCHRYELRNKNWESNENCYTFWLALPFCRAEREVGLTFSSK